MAKLDVIGSAIGALAVVSGQVLLFASWVYALIASAELSRWTLFVFDLIIPPWGIINGLWVWFHRHPWW